MGDHLARVLWFQFIGYCKDIVNSGRGEGVKEGDIWEFGNRIIGVFSKEAFDDDPLLWVWLVTWLIF